MPEYLKCYEGNSAIAQAKTVDVQEFVQEVFLHLQEVCFLHFLKWEKIYKKVTLSSSKHDLTRVLPFLFKIESVYVLVPC